MMKTLALAGAAVGLAALAHTSSPGGTEELAIGTPAPELNAKTWFNQIGLEPTLTNLRGQTILIEFWATW